MIIERGVALPEARGRKTQRALQIANAMEVGDSVFFEGADSKNKEIGILQYGFNKLGRKCTVRQVEGGMRVWRVE